MLLRWRCAYGNVDIIIWNTLMPKREVLVIPESEREVASFVNRVRQAGSLTVSLNGELFILEISSTKLSDEARSVLTRGGPGGL